MNVLEGRYPARDRIWLGVNSVQLVSTAEGMDIGGLRERVGQLAEKDPQLRWFSRPGDAPDRYRRAADSATAAAFAEGMVQELPEVDGPGTPLEAAVGAAMDADPGLPVGAFFAGQGLIGHRFPHVFGDGLTALTHLRRLLTGPIDDPRAPFPIPGLKRPLAHVLRERWTADGWAQVPGHVLADLRMPRFTPPAEDSEDVAPDTSPDTAPGTSPDTSSGRSVPTTVQVVIRKLDPSIAQSIKDWRKASGSGVSTVSVQMAAIRRGLAEAGLIPAEDGMYVVFDLRPTLKSLNTGGNFISVPYLQPSDPLDPISVNDSVQHASSSGLPLIGLARSVARASLSRRTPLPEMRSRASRRSVSFSHIRAGALLNPRRLAEPGDVPTMVAAAMPPNEGSLSFMLTEAGPHAMVTAVFCSPFTPRELVEQVLDRLTKDPIGLLRGP